MFDIEVIDIILFSLIFVFLASLPNKKDRRGNKKSNMGNSESSTASKKRTNIRSVSRSIVNNRPPSPTSRGFPETTTTPKPSPELLKPAPSDLASVLVEIRNPEDIEQCVLAKTFRDYLEQTEEEGLLDFVIVCNVLRNKESDVKVLKQKTEDLSDVVYIPSKDAVLIKTGVI